MTARTESASDDANETNDPPARAALSGDLGGAPATEECARKAGSGMCYCRECAPNGVMGVADAAPADARQQAITYLHEQHHERLGIGMDQECSACSALAGEKA